MAAVSTLPLQRRKNLVYGKKSTYNKTNVNAFFDDVDDESTEPEPALDRQPNLKTSYPVQKTETRAHSLKPIRPRTDRRSTFDVPSSDDEMTTPAKVISPPRLTHKRLLVDDTDTSDARLAPWEKRKVESDGGPPTKKSRAISDNPEAQLKQDLARATASSRKIQRPTTPGKGKSSPQSQSSMASSGKDNDTNALSATARLAARRNIGSHPNHKWPVIIGDDVESTPRKRVRIGTDSREDSADILMTDDSTVPICEPHQKEATLAPHDGDVYDFPQSSADELARSKSTAKNAPKGTKNAARRGKLTTYSSKSAPRKGVSAPARLSEMIPTDTDTTEETPAWSPSSTSRKSTPQQPSTPPSGHASRPQSAIKATGPMTPKQAQLWSKLLPSDTIAPSPSSLPIKDLSISAKRRTGASSITQKLTKSQSDVPRRRTRLVDRLKASAPSTDDELTDEYEEEDSEMVEIDHVVQNSVLTVEEAAAKDDVVSQAPQTSQSQTRAVSAMGSGPKITYSRMRSYLPEDSLEDDLMAGLPNERPLDTTQTDRAGKPTQAFQKSAFDLDDTDNEGTGSGNIRTIHELRASGRHITGMYDIEELFSDIRNHNTPNRGRRRSALMELAAKLTDKTFTSRFISQSLEMQLAAECGSSSDEIVDFFLAAAISLVMVSDPPEHAMKALHDHGVIAWLAHLLQNDVEISKLGSDRRNNMSKASQGSLKDFANMLRSQVSLWNDELPATMTPRLVALKALDHLVSRLRRIGDKTELLSAEQMLFVLPSPAQDSIARNELDAALSISILESLSTMTVALAWPIELLERIATAFPQLTTSSPTSRHALFLMLRLCLNLTNDNARNCQVLAKDALVRYLLEAVQQGFNSLESEDDDEKRTLALDLLVLAMGIMINLAEECDKVREHVVHHTELLSSLVTVFQDGQRHMLEAESVEESISNVAFGYLAVMLANLCQHSNARTFIASKLPEKNLGMLIEAVEEFVLHHQKVDMMNFEGEEGKAVWGAFTKKLKAVLARLKEVEYGL